MLFLQIAGGIFVGLLLLILAGYLFVRAKLRKLLAVEGQAGTPLEVHLNEDLAPDWTEEPVVQALVAELASLGFAPGRCYVVHEMPGVWIQSLFAAPFAAVIYRHPAAGNWVDIVFHGEDGTEVTASNAPTGGEIRHRPEQVKIFRAGARPRELLDVIRGETRGKSGQTIDDDNFREVFESAYRRDMAWRNSQGGATMEEFLQVAGNMEEKYSNEDIRDAFLRTKLQELHQWHAGCLESFMKSGSASWRTDDECAEYELFIVPAKTDAKAYVHYLADCGIVEEARKEKLSHAFPDNQDIRAMFQRISASFHEDLRPTLVGHTEFPVVADIYRRPSAGMTKGTVDC